MRFVVGKKLYLFGNYLFLDVPAPPNFMCLGYRLLKGDLLRHYEIPVLVLLWLVVCREAGNGVGAQ